MTIIIHEIFLALNKHQWLLFSGL